MNKLLNLFLILFLGLNGYTQSSFVKGYYINNSNEKIDCLIKNVDWLNNPTEFKYKITEGSEQKTLTINEVKEFAVLNTSNYVRHTVEIDRSSSKLNEMDYNKSPVFKKEKIFLKVLIKGKANLYLYEDKGLIRYFFNKELTDVKQLVYKNYLTDDNQVTKNNLFRRQLWNELKCEDISMNQLAKINYRQSELIKFFVKYNECTNSEFINYQTKQKKDLFNLTIRPGIRSSSLILGNEQYSWEQIDFDNGLTSFRLGLEAEFILGFNNNKWALLLEPTYQNFKSDASIEYNQTSGHQLFADVKYESIEINFGIRHYFPLNKNLKLFASLLGFYDNGLNSSIIINRSNVNSDLILDISSNMGLVLGIGCKFKEQFNLELRYLPKRNLLNSQGSWGTEFKSVSVVLGYSIF